MRRRVQATIVMVAFLLSIYSYSASQAEITSSKSWTFMVYSCADCDLEAYQLSYMLKMASVGSTADVDIVVQMDRIDGYDQSYGDWINCKRFHITQGLTPTIENAIDSLGEVNMGDPRTLADFLDWAVKEYPADHYFAMLIGHGWIDGVCPDWSSDDMLTPLEIRWALSQVKNATGAKMDIIGIEGCQQAALEIAYEIGDCADSIIASEEASTHWPYSFILSDLTASPTMDPDSLASMIVDYYAQYSWLGGDIMTLSAFNLSRIKSEVTLATTGLADILIANATRFAHAILEAASQAESHKPIWSLMEAESCRDLYDFALGIKREVPDVSTQLAAQNLINAIESACIAEWHGRGHPRFHGLYVYLPDDEEIYSARERIYGQLYSTAHPLWTQDTTWDDLLFLLFKTYAAGLRSHEQISDSSFTRFDSDNDGYLDALRITMNVSTTGEPIDVTARGLLIDPQGNVVDNYNCTLTATSAGGSGDIYLRIPNGGEEGLYSARISVYDEHGVFEDDVYLQPIAYLPEEIQHAVSVQGISPAKTVVGQGQEAGIEVIIFNDGNSQESVNVTTYVNGTLVNTTQLVMPSEGRSTFTIYWDTSGYGLGNYTVTSYAAPIEGEANLTDNFFRCDKEVCISFPGDIDADHDIDIFDIIRLADTYGTIEGQIRYESNCDINGDGEIDIFDLIIAAGNYGRNW